MINIIALLEVASEAVGHENAVQLMSDAKTIYGVYIAIQKAGKFDPSIMANDGTLQKVVDSSKRTMTTLSAMMDDPKQSIDVIALLKSAA